MPRVLAFAAALLVAACAEMQLQRPDAEAEFELSGRIAVRFKDESSTGNFAWRHGAGNDEVMITSPLGQGVARIVRDGNAVTLTDAEIARIEGLLPPSAVAGTRYDEGQMRVLDSER